MIRCLLVIIIAFPIAVFASDNTTQNIMQQIDYLTHRHEVLAQNIANVATPHYTTQDLEQPDLSPKRKSKRQSVRMLITNPKHLRSPKKDDGSYSRYSDKTPPQKPNGNNVDLKLEVTKLATNKDDITQQLKNYRTSFNMLVQAIGGAGQ